jgi:hypothetical protein
MRDGGSESWRDHESPAPGGAWKAVPHETGHMDISETI